MDSNTRIKRQIITFLFITFVLSAVAFFIIKHFDNLEFIILYMLCPGLSAIATKLIFKESLSSFAFGLKRPTFLVLAYILPIIYIIPVYVVIWSLFDNFPNKAYLNELMSVMPDMTEINALLILVGTSATIGVVGTAVTGVLGEELGWRGFLVPKLLKSNSFNKTSLIVGFIWLIWHVPILFGTGYFNGSNLYLGFVCFSVLVISLSFLLTWIQLQSQSIWPVCVLHASHNVFLQQILSPLTIDTEISQYLTGEFGVGVALTSALVSFIILRNKKAGAAICACQ